ncbi:ABC transporter substrate-binding protein [Salinarimonas rosea]|uniref:ABC transporter substrate-binding protein n=1 Tax=Salinarimonas rosea TaxID=552063 RepID=UPI000491753D|nr:ABC transporter substrate-binding protein [Salinarimonas rosea]
MRDTTKRLLAATAILALGLVPAAAQGSAEEPRAGGVLNMIAQPEPPMLMVGLNTQGPTLYVGGQIYQSLLTYGQNLEVLPSLAKAWTVSDDGLTYTFTLEDDVRWHDGEPFTSADVVFTADAFLREAHPRWRHIATTYVDSIEAPDEQTVVFRLSKPFSAFIYAFELSSFPVVPRHIYEGTDYRTNPANQTPIGTGPFKLQEWRRGSYIHLVRNEDYWKEGLPLLDELYFRIIPDSASRAVAFERGSVDVLRGGDVEGFEVRRLSGLPDAQTTTEGWEMYSPVVFLQMNLREPPFDDVRIRKAVMHALDRDFIVENVFFGLGEPATSPIASTTRFHSEDTVAYPYDLDEAKRLVEEAGLDAQAHPVRLMPLPYGSQWDRLAEYVKQQLEDIGLVVDIRGVDPGGWSQALSEWDFDVTFNFTYQYGDPALGVARHYLSSNIIKGTPFGNNQGYDNPRVDELFLEAAGAVDLQEAADAYAEAQTILTDEVALGWLFEMRNVTIMRDDVRNLVRTGIGVNEAMDEVWLDR